MRFSFDSDLADHLAFAFIMTVSVIYLLFWRTSSWWDWIIGVLVIILIIVKAWRVLDENVKLK